MWTWKMAKIRFYFTGYHPPCPSAQRHSIRAKLIGPHGGLLVDKQKVCQVTGSVESPRHGHFSFFAEYIDNTWHNALSCHDCNQRLLSWRNSDVILVFSRISPTTRSACLVLVSWSSSSSKTSDWSSWTCQVCQISVLVYYYHRCKDWYCHLNFLNTTTQL